jgi:hypothetical protein
MPPQRSIKAKEILEDIRRGLSKKDLMAKHGLSRKGLDSAFEQLIKAGNLGREDISEDLAWYFASDSAERRVTTRRHLYFELPVYLMDEPETKGAVRNISDKGVGIKGIRVDVGKIEKLIIVADQFGAGSHIKIDAKCVWSTDRTSTGKVFTGFQFVNVSSKKLEALWKLLDLVTFQE